MQAERVLLSALPSHVKPFSMLHAHSVRKKSSLCNRASLCVGSVVPKRPACSVCSHQGIRPFGLFQSAHPRDLVLLPVLPCFYLSLVLHKFLKQGI
jgi:hypothetical protein